VPTYQYACTACHHQLEAVQSFTDDPLTQCPVCDGQLRKLFGSVGIVFKGPGFYRTDSRSGSNGNGSNGAKPASTDSKESSSGGKEKKEKTAASTSTSSSASTGASTTAST
jgi:putative FmdB family regulatory protein